MARRTVSDVLAGAYELIRYKKQWATGDFALDAKGRYVSPNSKKAVRFCAIGAVHRSAGRASRLYKRATELLNSVALGDAFCFCDDGEEHIYHLNDELGHTEVKKMFLKAIKAAKANGR